MKYDSGNIGNVSVKVASGDITIVKADAYLVPEFQMGASDGGVDYDATLAASKAANSTAGGTDFATKLADIKGPDGQPFLTKTNNGRYQIVLHPTYRADQYLLDTKTGRTWHLVEGKDKLLLWEPLPTSEDLMQEENK